MAYQIRYGKDPVCARYGVRKSWRKTLLVLSLVVACAAAGFYMVQVVGLQNLLPGDPAVTGAALDNMLDSWRGGESLTQVFTAFCQEVISHAQILE